MNSIKQVSPGDTIFIKSTLRGTVRKVTVSRTTKTQIIAGSERFRKRDGRRVGASTWDYTTALVWSQGLEDQYRREIVERRLRAKLNDMSGLSTAQMESALAALDVAETGCGVEVMGNMTEKSGASVAGGYPSGNLMTMRDRFLAATDRITRANGWTLDQLAADVGVTRVYLSRCRHGHAKPSNTLLALMELKADVADGKCGRVEHRDGDRESTSNSIADPAE